MLTRVGNTSDARVKTAALTKLAELAPSRLSPTLESAASVSLQRLRDTAMLLVDPGRVLAIDPVPRRAALSVTSQQLMKALDPKTTVRQALDWRLQLSPELSAKWRTKPFIERIMAAPRFDRPMYRALDEYDREWLVPGLSLIPDTDFVTVLSTNDEFMEAFLVGLSDEFGHELLWRGYPTDRRGTYFHRFWSPQRDELTRPIHAFQRTSIGTHVAIGGVPQNGGGAGGAARKGRAVIVVKSELVRRFPDLIIQAIRNQGTPQAPVFEAPNQPQITATVLFAEHLEPDIALVGVDLSVEELDGPGWWIVIAEHPSATRFELPGGVQAPANSPDHLSVNHPHAAAFAKDRLHDPIRVAFEATDLIVTERLIMPIDVPADIAAARNRVAATHRGATSPRRVVHSRACAILRPRTRRYRHRRRARALSRPDRPMRRLTRGAARAASRPPRDKAGAGNVDVARAHHAGRTAPRCAGSNDHA